MINGPNKIPLTDRYQRTFPYLRLSITDACNFRCTYCLPNGYIKKSDQFLTPEEIERLVRAFVDLGTIKVRLTGGEPTLRKDLPEIVRRLKTIPNLQKIVMTTNGYRLKQQAKQWYDLGITALNVSIDSLDRAKFHHITGHDKLPDLLQGIDIARQTGFKNIKINAVLLKGLNDDPSDFAPFLDWVQREPLTLRFIELMQTGDNQAYFLKNHVSATIIREQLLAKGFSLETRRFDDGPAIEYAHPDYQGKIGLIAPYSKNFCLTCNRLRLTARGELMLCLFGTKGYPLRDYLANDAQQPLLQQTLRELLLFKKESHSLHQGETGVTPHLASLGG